MSDQTFRRTWQSTLVASCFSLAACGGGGDSGSGGQFQSITFGYPGGVTLAAGPATLKATSTSGLPVTFRSETPTVCTVSGDQLTVLSAEECLVVASQGGGVSADGRLWAPADDTSQLFKVLKHPQAVTFTPPDYVLSSATSSIEISGSADSGLPVTFSTSTPSVCTINGSTLQLTGKGSCAVTATQEGDATYAPQTAQRFIAVDPLLVADGFAPLAANDDGSGSTSVYSSSIVMSTKQGGGVAAIPWSSLLGGWEECAPGATNANWCYRTVSADGSTLTSALDLPDSKVSGWYTGFNRINIFAPGLTAFNGSGDTVSGLRVTTEKVLAFTLNAQYTNGKPLVVSLDMGKRNGNCNVELSAVLWTLKGFNSYGIALSDFAVTNACGLSGVAATTRDAIRALPNPNGPEGATQTQKDNALAAYKAALEQYADARAAATTQLQTSDIARVRFWLDSFNDKFKASETDTMFRTDLSIKGAITVQ